MINLKTLTKQCKFIKIFCILSYKSNFNLIFTKKLTKQKEAKYKEVVDVFVLIDIINYCVNYKNN